MSIQSDVLSEIGEKRNILELKEYIVLKYNQIYENHDLRKKHILRVGLFEKFRAELCPLFLYSQITNKSDLSVQYQAVIGSQQYDSIVHYIDHTEKLEFTEYINGKDDFLSGQKLIDNGHSSFDIPDCYSAENKYIEAFSKNVKKKSTKNYSSVHLIFVLSTYSLDFLYRDEYGAFISKLNEIIHSHVFTAAKVSLLIKKGHILDDIVTSTLDTIW